MNQSRTKVSALNKSMLASKNLPKPITKPSEGHHWIRVLAAELALRLNDAREMSPNLWPKTLVLHARKGEVIRTVNSDSMIKVLTGYQSGRSKQTAFPFTRDLTVDTIALAGDKLWNELVGNSTALKVTQCAIGIHGDRYHRNRTIQHRRLPQTAFFQKEITGIALSILKKLTALATMHQSYRTLVHGVERYSRCQLSKVQAMTSKISFSEQKWNMMISILHRIWPDKVTSEQLLQSLQNPNPSQRSEERSCQNPKASRSFFGSKCMYTCIMPRVGFSSGLIFIALFRRLDLIVATVNPTFIHMMIFHK